MANKRNMVNTKNSVYTRITEDTQNSPNTRNTEDTELTKHTESNQLVFAELCVSSVLLAFGELYVSDAFVLRVSHASIAYHLLSSTTCMHACSKCRPYMNALK